MIYTVTRVGLDLFAPTRHTPTTGTKVRKVKAPFGCPPNGTLQHCYVIPADADPEHTYPVLILQRSLTPA